MKKNVFLAVTLLAFIAVGAFAQYDSESDFQVTKTATEVTITKYVGKKTAVNIPPRIQNLPVTTIGTNAFVNIATITSVTIPEGVKTIDVSSFAGTRLTSITIPASVTTIGIFAFNGCPITSVTFKGKIMLGEVAVQAFGNDNIDLHSKYYLYGPSGTPGTYTKSGSTWTNQTAVADAEAKNLSDFQVTKTGNAITITKYIGKATVVNIPSTIQNTPVTIIGDQAFYGNKDITSVTIPNGVTTIGNNAFGVCTSLASVTIPNSVTSIGRSAFEGCKNLTSVTIPAGVKSIGLGAFASCGLVSVTFLGTIPSSGFDSSYTDPFYPSDLRDLFYAKDKNNGTPGTYTRSKWTSSTWTKK